MRLAPVARHCWCSCLERVHAAEESRRCPTKLRTTPQSLGTVHRRELRAHSIVRLLLRPGPLAFQRLRNRCAIVDLSLRLIGARSPHKQTRRTRTRRRPSPPRTTKPVEIEQNAVATNASWRSRLGAQHEPDAAHGLYQFNVLPVVEFPAQVREVNVDHIIKRCRAIRFSPDLTRNHLPRYRFIMMLREKRKQI